MTVTHAAFREARLARTRAERRRVAMLQGANRQPEPTATVKKLLGDLETAVRDHAKARDGIAEALKAGKKATAADRRKADMLRPALKLALGQMRDLSARIDALWTVQTNEAWAGHALAETVRLEEARGGEVEAPHVGPYRMKSRDGFQSLLESGRLGQEHGVTQKRYEAGLSYREGVEARTSDLGSQLGAGEGRAGHDNDKLVLARLARTKKLQRLGTIERAVTLQCRDEPACLQMIRWVAVAGHSLSAFGKGRAFGRHLDALLRALDVADAVLHGNNGESK